VLAVAASFRILAVDGIVAEYKERVGQREPPVRLDANAVFHPVLSNNPIDA
jgi:hypothetical protein